MGYSRLRLRLVFFVFLLLAAPLLVSSVSAQGLMGGSGLDLAPSNPFGMPGSAMGLPGRSDSIYLSDRMLRDILPPIPNLQVGYLYSFGKYVNAGRLTLDYLQPVRLGSDSVVFAEAHGEFTNISNTISLWWRGVVQPTYFYLPYRNATETTRIYFNEQTDLSIGGGYRKILGGSTFLGVNGFYDANFLGNRLYQSGGVGIEFATLLNGNDAADLTFNWYGIPLKGAPFTGEFRRGPGDYDFQVGYSHELYERGPDLRLHATGYKFGAGYRVYGGRIGAELKSRDGVLSLKYEVAHDMVNRTYHTVGAFVNVGFRLDALLSGESPFEAPAPIFKSPRNFERRLADPVKRAFGGLSASNRRNASWVSCLCGIEGAAFTLVAEWVMTPGLMADGSSTACDSTPSYTFPNRTFLMLCSGDVVPSGRLEIYIGLNNGCTGGAWVNVPSGWCNVAYVLPGLTLQSWRVRNSTGGDFDPGTVRLRVYRY